MNKFPAPQRSADHIMCCAQPPRPSVVGPFNIRASTGLTVCFQHGLHILQVDFLDGRHAQRQPSIGHQQLHILRSRHGRASLFHSAHTHHKVCRRATAPPLCAVARRKGCKPATTPLCCHTARATASWLPSLYFSPHLELRRKLVRQPAHRLKLPHVQRNCMHRHAALPPNRVGQRRQPPLAPLRTQAKNSWGVDQTQGLRQSRNTAASFMKRGSWQQKLRHHLAIGRPEARLPTHRDQQQLAACLC